MSDSLLSQAEIDALLSQTSSKADKQPVSSVFRFNEGAAETEKPLKQDRKTDHHGSRTMGPAHPNMDRILDIPLRISVNLGEVTKPIMEVIALGPGAILEFDRTVGEPVDIVLNGKLIARGEVVVVGEHFGVRISHIVSPAERVRKMA